MSKWNSRKTIVFLCATFELFLLVACGGSSVGQHTATQTPVLTQEIKPSVEVPYTPSDFPSVTMTPTEEPAESTATPVPTERTLYNILKNMLLTGDGSQVDISDLNVTFNILSETFTQLANGECMVAYNSFYQAPVTQSVKGDGKYLKSTGLSVVDPGFQERFALVQESVNEAMSRISPTMSDLEKALVLHDYVVEKATYRKGVDGQYDAWGILAYGRGVCHAYTNAYDLLLSLCGIENYHVSSDEMNHIWNLVKIDGDWYHVDCTWDDTQSPVKGETGHVFFLRNDDEFRKKLSHKHYNYAITQYGVKQDSISKKYVTWSVHDLVGTIFYKDGNWYYYDRGLEVKIDLEK